MVAGVVVAWELQSPMILSIVIEENGFVQSVDDEVVRI
jgi:hypothetical protein